MEKLKGRGKWKGKVGRPCKQSRQTEDSGEGNRLHDSVNVDDVPKENLNGLSDINGYDNDDIPNEYDNEEENISKVDSQTFKIPE